MKRIALLMAALLACAVVTFAQEQKPEQKPEPKPEQKQAQVRPVNPSARLTAAKTAMIRNAEGSDIPYNVISSAIESWGRFNLVNSAETADIIVEISAPGTSGSGISMSSSVNRTGPTGRPEQSSGTTRDISNAPVRMIVYDARSHIALWSASEQPHFAVKQKAKEDNLVQASERLFSKFREKVEPSPAQ
jgi:hypothetical protein